jgi:hypothetical protein
MVTSKFVVSTLAVVALVSGGVAQAESIRAGASLPVAKVAKLSRKNAKQGVELKQNAGDTKVVNGVSYVWVLAIPATGLAGWAIIDAAKGGSPS